ncbi:MAG: sigma-70 family RNA polymerase sigma factor [Pseudomonadales bacterium]|nr:sigma-70 family RNA polymerase sigma factor [Pseudomonadales bacterium]
MSQLDLALISYVEAAQRGDQSAFSTLILKTQNTVHSIAQSIVHDLDSCEDVAQQVYIATWQGIDKLKNPASFLPWLRQTTRFTAYNFLRNNKNAGRVPTEHAEALLAQIADPQEVHDVSLEREQQTRLIANFVSDLPTESREIVLLYYREDQSTKQVASLLGITDVNVRKKLSRIRATLRDDVLQKYGDVILHTAPPVSFGGIVLASLTASPKVAAATTGSVAAKVAITAGKIGTGFAAGALGSLIGIIASIFAIRHTSRLEEHKLSDQLLVRRYNFYKQLAQAAAIIFGLAMPFVAVSSNGALLPTVTTIAFVFTLVFSLWRMRTTIWEQQRRDGSYDEAAARRERFGLYIGATVGGLGGFAGLVLGLYFSGRI